MGKDTYRVVTRGADGQIRIRDYDNQEALLKRHTQIGVDDCSTDLGLRGLPVFRGLVGPKGLPDNVLKAWEAAIPKVLENAEFKKWYEHGELMPAFMPHDQYVKYIDETVKKQQAFFEKFNITQAE